MFYQYSYRPTEQIILIMKNLFSSGIKSDKKNTSHEHCMIGAVRYVGLLELEVIEFRFVW